MIRRPAIYLLVIPLFAMGCEGHGQQERADVLHTKKSVAADPLPSWNEGPTKSAIIAYVTEVTTPGLKDYIPIADRIATFDNDGTLWAERPYVQELFAMYRAKEMADKNPALALQQ